MAYNAADRLQSPTGSSSNVKTKYTYVPEGRLGGVSKANGTSIHLYLDPNGNLKARSGRSINDSLGYDQANGLNSATSSGSGT